MMKETNTSTNIVQYNIGNNLLRQNLLFYRTQHNLTQKDLGLRTGLARTYLSELESGMRNPTVSKVFQIAISLRLEPWRLLKPLSSKERIYGNENDFTPLDFTLSETTILSIDQYKMILIKNIKHLRKTREWGQDELANMSGLSTSFIRCIEQGIKDPTLESLSKIAIAFHIPVWKLIKGIDSNSIWFNQNMWL